jgi:exonuclease SbcC
LKILELRLKNLNSLYGEWCIDFTHPDYHSNGIFALTGPTGAGKSTILDAICLALYGATPRLGKITKSSNDLMSRHCGECYAEVLFESKAGRFRCRWEQRRARKSHSGKLQDQKHEIGEADSKKLLETKKSLVLSVIEEKTGMDFERFTRSILLAQGGFDNFLKADVEQKSKILEQITGTEIYTQISQLVHERWREEKDQLQRLLAETESISLLEPEQEQAFKVRLFSQQQAHQSLSEQSHGTQKAIIWLETVAKLEQELAWVHLEIETLAKQQEAFQLDKERLDQALKAAVFDVQYAGIRALRQQLNEDQNSLQQLQSQEPKLQIAFDEGAQHLESAEQALEKNRRALADVSATLQKVRSLDQQMQQQCVIVEELQQACVAEQNSIHLTQQALAAHQSKLRAEEDKYQSTQLYLQNNAQDGHLASLLPSIEHLSDNLLIKQKNLKHLQVSLEQVQQTLLRLTVRANT